MADIYGFDRERALRLKALADRPELINQIPNRPRRQPSGGGAEPNPLRMFRTPAGGIPAATSAVAGSAVCTEFPDGIGGNPGGTATVFNHRTNVIPQNVFVLVQMFRTTFGQERLFVVESNCPAGITNPNPDPEPPVDDQGGGGSPP